MIFQDMYPEPRIYRVVALVLVLVVVGGCSTYMPFDSVAYLRGELAERIDAEVAQTLVVPFELAPHAVDYVDREIPTASDERRKVEWVLDLIFQKLELEYELAPTRDANGAFTERSGNCLSFVNLFVGVARQIGLTPFFVEVTDYQRWNLREGMVVSQGHIVAGLNLRGELVTYDFLPYRPKSYRDFEPIDDLTATGHYYNNLGAEALIEGDFDRALELLELATYIAPGFEKAVNNLGVALFRTGRLEEAIAAYERGLAVDPENVPLLTNLARAYQSLGDGERALEILSSIDDSNNTNPFFFLYKGQLALAEGDQEAALRYMREALRRDTELPEVHLGLVKLFLASGDLDRARHHIQRALKLDATNSEARRYATLLRSRAELEETP